MFPGSESTSPGRRRQVGWDADAATLRPLPAEPGVAPQPERAWQAPLLLAGGYALLLFLAGFALHPILGWTAELDNYVGQARWLSAGIWPRDPCHPLGYPTVVALTEPLFGSFFVAGRFVSAIAAGLLVWGTHALVRPAFGGAAATGAALLVALHPLVLVTGMLANSDMMAAGVAALVLVLAARAWRAPAGAGWFVLGLAFALAYWTRYPSMALLVAIVPALLLGARPSWRDRMRRLAWFAGGTALGLVPHCAMSHAQFGSLFHDESWRNLAAAHAGAPAGWIDFNYLYAAPFDSWWSVVRQDPLGMLAQGADRFGALVTRDLPVYLASGGQGESPGLYAWVLYALIPLGWGIAIARRRPGLLLGGLFAICYLAAAAWTFVVWDRIALLVFAPLLGAVGGSLWLVGAWLRRWPDGVRPVQVVLLGLLLVPLLLRLPERIEWLRSREPQAELGAIQQLVREHGSDVRIATSMVALAEHAGVELSHVPTVHGWDFDARRYVLDLAAAVERERIGFIVLGRVTFGSSERLAALAQVDVPPGFVRIREEPDLLVWRVEQPFMLGDWQPAGLSDWQPVVSISPNPCAGGEVTFAVDLADAPDGVREVGLIAQDPHGTWQYFEVLQRDGSRAVLKIHADGIQRGTWQIRAHVVLPAARLTGPVVAFQRNG